MKFNSRVLGIVFGTAFIFTPALVFASFDSNLSFGARGSAVVSLQQFLISQKLLAGDLATGYFGNLTLRAVKGFQTSQGVTPVSGFFGPLTRAKANLLMSGGVTTTTTTASSGASCAFQDSLVPDAPKSRQDGKQVYFPSLTKWQLCKNGQWIAPPSPTFTASPTSGTATLMVTFSGVIPGHSCPRPGAAVDGGSVYKVDYGDTQKEELSFVPACSETYSLKHSYSSPGIYNPKLIQESYSFGVSDGSKIIGTAIVTVN
ncbi:MAG: peptidoglycan-binding protein [bacterium]|nr:peptidoglycan-binding protein [bacterium]